MLINPGSNWLYWNKYPPTPPPPLHSEGLNTFLITGFLLKSRRNLFKPNSEHLIVKVLAEGGIWEEIQVY